MGLSPTGAPWQNGFMPDLQITGVPAETHAVLRSRAAAANQSLEQYVRSWLIREASRPTVDEVLDRSGRRSGGSVSFASALEALREDRARR
jgi:antitoxin FitA